LTSSLSNPSSDLAGIEVKNIREWIYPHQDLIRDLIFKCLHLKAIPTLIARRIHYSTFTVLGTCGIIIHQTYNQRLPATDYELAERAKNKTLLGYHDIRLGNAPDARLRHFLYENLPNLLESAREKFERFKDLLCGYAKREMGYDEFAARVRRRRLGQPEDGNFPFDDK